MPSSIVLEHASLDEQRPTTTEEEDESQGHNHLRHRRLLRRNNKNNKGDYDLVVTQEEDEFGDDQQGDEEEPRSASNNDEDDDNDEGEPLQQDELLLIRDSQDRSLFATCQRICHVPFLPDDRFTVRGVKLLDGSFAIKLFKLGLITCISIASMYHVVRSLGWEHDPRMRLADMWLYESNFVILDTILFFVVGRLHQQRGVDHAAWLAVMFAANLYASAVTNLPFMQHSVTLYEMHCKWPWKLWVFVGLLLPLIITVILLHVHRSVQDRVFVMKLIELILSVLLFLLPPLTSDYFHFHHWFAGWLIGMHCNFDVWWSRAAMAWCWGLYVNGIAAYGRDPLLTCGYAYWLSTDLRCPYMQCYLDAMEQMALQNETSMSSNQTHVAPMTPPDWRNCSADAYHP